MDKIQDLPIDPSVSELIYIVLIIVATYILATAARFVLGTFPSFLSGF